MRIAVAGASGKVGRAVVQRLLDAGETPLAIVRSEQSAQRVPQDAQIKVIDYKNTEILSEVLKDRTHVINCTGSYDPDASYDSLLDANVLTTTLLIDSCPNSLQRFIHIGSISSYGKDLIGVIKESTPKIPKDNYGMTKKDGEDRVLSRKDRIKSIILEPGMIYGPEFEAGYFTVLRMLKTGKYKYLGDAQNHIPLIHIDDLVQAIMLALESQSPTGSAYIIVQNPQLTQKELIQKACSSLGVQEPKSSIGAGMLKFLLTITNLLKKLQGKKSSLSLDMVDQISLDRLYDCTKAREELGLHDFKDFDSGIAEISNIYLKKSSSAE